MLGKAFIVSELGGEDSKPWAVVRHGEAYDGPRYKRKCLFIVDWFHTEDDARLCRDRENNP